MENVKKVQDFPFQISNAIRLNAVKYLYTGTSSPRSLRALPEKYRVDVIHQSDVNYIVSKWSLTKNSDKAKQLMKHFISSYPNVAIYDTTIEPAQPVSWATSSGLGIIYNLQTLKDHQGKGLGTVVVQELTKKLLAKGVTPIAYIEIGNEASINLFKKSGYERVGSEGYCFYS